MLRGDVDVAILSEEAGEVPILVLALVLPLPERAAKLFRQIVLQPLGAGRHALDEFGGDAGFLLELAKRGRPRFLAVVDAALRHLPRLVRVIDPSADEYLALGVE